MEGFGVPHAPAACRCSAVDSDAVEADELCEFMAGAAEESKAGVQVLFALWAGVVAVERPLEEPRLHGLVEDSGGFARYDVDGTGGEVELFPLEGEDVTETLAEGSEAAADGGCPLVGEFGEEQGDFVEGEGFFHDLFVFGVVRDGYFIARVFVYDLSVYSPREGGADGGKVFPAGGSSYLGAAVVDPCFDVRFGDMADRGGGFFAEPVGEYFVGGFGVVVGRYRDSAEFALQHEVAQFQHGGFVCMQVGAQCVICELVCYKEGSAFGLGAG